MPTSHELAHFIPHAILGVCVPVPLFCSKTWNSTVSGPRRKKSHWKWFLGERILLFLVLCFGVKERSFVVSIRNNFCSMIYAQICDSFKLLNVNKINLRYSLYQI